MKHIIGAIIFSIIGSSWSPACADNDLKACIKYQHSDYTWSHEYAVKGYTVKGYEINKQARDKGYKSDYNDYATYFIVGFSNGGYISLELDSGYLPSFDKEVYDQSGTKWKIREGWYRCGR